MKVYANLHHRSGDLEIQLKNIPNEYNLHHRSGDLEKRFGQGNYCQLLHHRSGDLENIVSPPGSLG